MADALNVNVVFIHSRKGEPSLELRAICQRTLLSQELTFWFDDLTCLDIWHHNSFGELSSAACPAECR